MARKRAKIFSHRELQVMNAVWKLQKASVREIQKEMGGKKAGAYTSVATMLKLLEEKGAIRHVQKGRRFYYIPKTTKEQEQEKALTYLVKGFFGGNVNTLIRSVLDTFEIAPEAILEIDDEIDDDEL